MYLGIDFGTSGCRATVIDEELRLISESAIPLPEPSISATRIEQASNIWLDGLERLLSDLADKTDLSRIRRLAIDGTSGTILLCSHQGEPLTMALMYNDSSSEAALHQLRLSCPEPTHLTLTSSSGLSKALQLASMIENSHYKILSQADYLSNHLCGRWGYGDYHNALKLGFDLDTLQWPDWITDLFSENALPQVVPPGQALAPIREELANRFGFNRKLQVCAGSTDANAAFIATGCNQPGDAVSSLGSTLVLKLLSEHPIEDLASGVYSHRLGDFWLTGGASNCGASILRRYFDDEQLRDYSSQIDLSHPTGLHYYPLLNPGERFPVYDPQKQPALTPRPDSDIEFLQGLLESLSRIEKQGYDRLVQLGAAYPRRVQSCGGGARNPQWTLMRQQILGVEVIRAAHDEASYGSALLARHGLKDYLKF